MDKAVKINNLSVTLGGTVEALTDVNLELPAGKTVGFIGPSGAGKTTLIRAIVGRLQVPAGTVIVFGEEAGSKRLRSQLSYMTQALSLYEDLTAAQNLKFFASMCGVNTKHVKDAVEETLKTVELTDRSGSLVRDLSGGQRQRVSLAVALVAKPKLLVLDEPTVGLDPVLRGKLWKLFNKLTAQGASLIISSHVMDEAERCDDLVLLRDGRVLAHDSPAELVRKTGAKNVEQSFLKLVGGTE